MCCKWGNIKVKCVGEVFEKIGVRKVKYINKHLFWWCVGIYILDKWNNTNNDEIDFSYVFQNMFLGEVFQEVKFWRWLMDIRKLKVMVFRQITLLFFCAQIEFFYDEFHFHPPPLHSILSWFWRLKWQKLSPACDEGVHRTRFAPRALPFVS